MASPDTRPRIALRKGDAEPRRALLIFAGYALEPLPRKQPRLYPLGDELELGRDDSIGAPRDLEDTLLSRRHARITRGADGGHLLQDLGSTNGTWLDGIRLVTGVPQPLREGATFLVGGQVFVYRRVTSEQLQAMREVEAAPFAPTPTLSPVMALLARKLRRLAGANVDLLLEGEPGVGHEVYARAVHQASGRTGPFLAIDCASVAEPLFEATLFGATNDGAQPGLLERAEGGTLFLDELADVPASAQARLRRFLQNRQLAPEETARARTLDVRLIAATRRPRGPHAGDDDLISRFGAAPLALPPLRDRPEDLGPMIDFLAPERMGFVPEAYLALFLHGWKGNVGELEKAVTVSQMLADGEAHVDLDHLPTAVAARIEAGTPSSRRRRRPTRDELVEALARHGGDVAELARELGRQRTLVWRWLRENEIRANDFRN